MISDMAETLLTGIFHRGRTACKRCVVSSWRKAFVRSGRRRGAWTRGSKHPIQRHRDDDGRQGTLRLLPPARWSLGTNRVGYESTGMNNDTTWEKRRSKGEPCAGLRVRWKNRTAQRDARKLRSGAKARPRAEGLVVGTVDVARSLSTVCTSSATVRSSFRRPEVMEIVHLRPHGVYCVFIWGRREPIREARHPWSVTIDSCRRVHRSTDGKR